MEDHRQCFEYYANLTGGPEDDAYLSECGARHIAQTALSIMDERDKLREEVRVLRAGIPAVPLPDRSVDAEVLAKDIESVEYATERDMIEAAVRIRALARVENNLLDMHAGGADLYVNVADALTWIRGEGWNEPSDEEITRDLRRIANGESIIMKCDYKELSRKAADRLEQLGKSK